MWLHDAERDEMKSKLLEGELVDWVYKDVFIAALARDHIDINTLLPHSMSNIRMPGLYKATFTGLELNIHYEKS